jgi:hypothetical protein
VRPREIEQVREKESRWALPAALATFLAVALMVAAAFVNDVNGTEDAEVLRSVEAHGGSVIASGLMRALAFALLAIPLAYLFRAVRARSERVRPQLIGLVVAAPLFLAVATGLGALAQREAADEFTAGEAKSTLSPKEGRRKVEDDEASNAISEASLAPLVSGLTIAGYLGFAITLFYCCLWAMRTGLLTRFWGSLGMALGIAALLGLILFTLVWFVYFGLLILGRLPGGRPPAWKAGEAVPWPTPGERAAAELQPSEEAEASAPAVPEDPSGEGGEKRKRKQRD